MERIVHEWAERPRRLMWLCLAAAAMVAWSVLALSAGGDVWADICGAADAPLTSRIVLWIAMSLAMMLPAAAPMVAAYMDIAGAARAKAAAVVPPAVLIAGYMTAWIAFSVLAAALQHLLPRSDAPLLAAALLLLAGAYQFSSLKHACLSKCRSPMPYFLGNWSDRPAAVFRMGLTQGLNCLGCCWALMLLGLALGAMNLVWMAALAAVAILERTLPEPRGLIYGLGLGFIVAGLALGIGTLSWP